MVEDVSRRKPGIRMTLSEQSSNAAQGRADASARSPAHRFANEDRARRGKKRSKSSPASMNSVFLPAQQVAHGIKFFSKNVYEFSDSVHLQLAGAQIIVSDMTPPGGR